MKYEIIKNDNKVVDGITVYRINSDEYGLGGYIQNENNLSQEGKCWIEENAVAMGKSSVIESAILKGVTSIKDNVKVSGNAMILDSVISGNCSVVASHIRYSNLSGNLKISACFIETSSLEGDMGISKARFINKKIIDCGFNEEIYKNKIVNEPTPFKLDDNFFEYSIYTKDNEQWFATTLYKYAYEVEHQEVFKIPLKGLSFSHDPWRAKNLLDYAEHMNRVNKCDTDYPILLDSDGVIADGYHRVAKALLEGKKYIKAIRLDDMPKPDKYKDDE